MVLLGQNINLMLTMLPTLLFVIGISNCVHLLSKFLDEIKAGENKLAACITTIKETGTTTLITSTTTAAGFILLIFIPIKPIQTFGFFVGCGVMITYGISMLLFPSMFILLPKRCFLGKKSSPSPNHLISNLFLWIVKKPKITMVCTGLFIVVSLLGVQNIKINNYFLDDLNNESSLKQDLLFFENNFAGIRPFEMGIHLGNASQNIFDLDVLKEIDRLEIFLKSTYGVGAIFSPLTIIKMANQSLNGGKVSAYKLPDSQEKLDKTVRQLRISGKLSKFNSIITPNLKFGRLTGRTNDLGNAAFIKKNKELSQFLSQNIDKNIVWVKQTGAANLMDQTNRSIATNLTKGLIAAFVLIAIIVGILFKSVKMAIISLVPNMLPLLVIAGLMGYAGIDLKVGTSLIFTIAFGIAVDDTIHLLSKLKLELNKGRSPVHALKNALNTCGKAISLTTFILSSGFLIFLFSEFSSTFFIGFLICAALILALLADFFILPVLIILSNYGKNK